MIVKMPKLSERGWLERWTAPIAGALVVAMLGQMLTSIWWARGESDKLAELERQTQLMRSEHERLDTKLNTADQGISARLELLDRTGTRAMERVSADLTRVTSTAEKLADRVSAIDQRVINLEGKTMTQLQADIKRLDEQQTRIISALDNTYNTLTEFIRQYAHGPMPMQPTPGTKPKSELNAPGSTNFDRLGSIPQPVANPLRKAP